MTTPTRRYAAEPLYLPNLWPVPDAVPAPGCRRCAELADDRTAARAAGDLSGVSDVNVLMRRHPHH